MGEFFFDQLFLSLSQNKVNSSMTLEGQQVSLPRGKHWHSRLKVFWISQVCNLNCILVIIFFDSYRATASNNYLCNKQRHRSVISESFSVTFSVKNYAIWYQLFPITGTKLHGSLNKPLHIKPSKYYFISNYLHQGGYVFAGTCLFVYLLAI